MKYHFKRLLFCVAFSAIHLISAQESSSLTAIDGQNPQVITSDQGFLVVNRKNPTQKKETAATTLTITAVNGIVFINNQTTGTHDLSITPLSGNYHVKNHTYYGPLLIGVEHENPVLQHPQTHEIKTVSNNAPQQPASEPIEKVTQKQLYTVRVLLDEGTHSFFNTKQWTLHADGGFILKDDRGRSVDLEHDDTLTIASYYDCIYANGYRYDRERLYISPKKSAIEFQDNQYQGSFLVVRDDDHVSLINNLDLEDYVFSVLRTESWPGWPLEVNKVFAIACRSYAIAMILRSKSQKLPYHIKNTNVHQTYTGMHESPMLKRAVKETDGIFLTYRGKPIIAMFDACCGGVIPGNMRGFNFAQAPYLKRTYPCTYCKSCKIYNWSVHYPAATFLSLIHEGGTLRKLKDIKVNNKDKAGVVHAVSIKTSRGYSSVTGKKLYSLIKGIKSFCFTVHKKGDSIIFKGRGYGHHLGLCQWGAREMVRRGKSYREVLQFYYPSTRFMQLT